VKEVITSKIRTWQWLLFILLTVGLILSLIGLTMWVAVSRGEQTQVNPENFRLVFSVSMLGSVIFSVLLIVAALRLRKWMRR
jgi:uncharacterized membrane protein